MEQIKDTPAFPLAFQKQVASGMPRTETYTHHGMTLRDYFAAKAMQGYLTSIGVTTSHTPTDDDIARYSYQMADAMCSARQITLPDQPQVPHVDTSMWDACNPGCDPEFNGSKSSSCSCEPAKAAMLKAREK